MYSSDIGFAAWLDEMKGLEILRLGKRLVKSVRGGPNGTFDKSFEGDNDHDRVERMGDMLANIIARALVHVCTYRRKPPISYHRRLRHTQANRARKGPR